MAPFRDEEIVTCFCHKPVNGGAGMEDSTSVAKVAESPLPHTAPHCLYLQGISRRLGL